MSVLKSCMPFWHLSPASQVALTLSCSTQLGHDGVVGYDTTSSNHTLLSHFSLLLCLMSTSAFATQL